MNFPAHAWVAIRAGLDDPGLVLGVMLPDLAPLVGVRFGDELPDSVRTGQRLHHIGDAAFHDHPTFRAGVAGLRTELRDLGLGTGARRAGAHVGYELLLDGVVDWDADARALFDAALAAGLSLHPVASDDTDALGRWRQLVTRMRGFDIPARRSSTEEVADRVEGILRRRPRLALRDGDAPSLVAALVRAEPTVATHGPTLLDDMTRELVGHLATTNAASAHDLTGPPLIEAAAPAHELTGHLAVAAGAPPHERARSTDA